MAVSRSLRFQILRRDNHACRYCGRSAPEVKLTVDHVVPEALGGADDPSNLVTACAECNGGKSATPPDAAVVADVAEDALRWRRAMEVAAEMATRERSAREAFCEAFQDRWTDWTWTDRQGTQHAFDLPGNWEVRVGELMSTGLTVADIHDAIDTAMAARHVKDEFAYFLAVTRNMAINRQSVAAELLRQGVVR